MTSPAAISKSPKASLSNRTAIVGIAETEYARHGGITDRTEFALCCEAIKLAADDAGIDVKDIDGFCSFSYERHEPVQVQLALGIPELRFSNIVWGAGGGGCSGSVLNAAIAINSGICKHVVVYRSLCQGQYERYGQYRPRPTNGSYIAPYGLMSPAQMVALTFRRHMHQYNTPAEVLGHVAVAFRAHAQRNPRAVQYGKPLTLDMHQNSRMIADPFRLFDCCLETDGAGALIVTSRERAKDLKNKPVRVLAAAQASGPRWGVGPMGSHNMPIEDYASTNSKLLGRVLFEMAGLTPADLDCVQIYDAFSGLLVMALEDFGICKPGEAASFIMAGNLDWQSGALPANTSGGMLSEGYLQGLNLILEGVRQMRGTSTAQVADAKTCLVSSGGAQAHKSALILAN